MRSYTEALERALGRIVADAERRLSAIEAESAATIAKAEARVAECEARIALLDAKADARLASLKDGEPVDPAVVAHLVEEAVSALPPAEPGESVTVEDVAPLLEELVGKAVAALPSPEPGKSVTVEDVAPLLEELVGKAVAALPPAEPGESVTVEDVAPLLEELVGKAVAALPPPKDGKDGVMPVAKAWADRVHYEGEIVTHEGCTWQASVDTGRAPPHEDWACLARAGRDGEAARSFRLRGTFDESCTDYQPLDVVMLNGASFAARREEPGACPGEGWQLLAMQGKRGKPGEPGPVRTIVSALESAEIDSEGMVTLKNSDGTEVSLDLYPLLSKVAS